MRGRKRAPEKKNKLSQPIDRRRYQKLQQYHAQWCLRTGRKKLGLARISREAGYSDGRASGIFHGHEPLNIEWMLIFAQAYDVAPQKIWQEDWPFADMTRVEIPPSFALFARRWETLTDTTKEAIRKLLGKR